MLVARMKKLPGLKKLDRLTLEEVRAFKREAVERQSVAKARAAAEERVIVAEGDSWFDYPVGVDVVDCLRRYHGYTVLNHSLAGDTLENMVYGSKVWPRRGYRAIPSRLNEVVADLKRTKARALVFSGGGNDIAGAEFAQFLEHQQTGLQVFRRGHAMHMIEVVFHKIMGDLIERVTAASPRVRIFTHGYGYPVPDGRGIGVAIGLSFIGPWLRPALAAKRIDAATEGTAIVRELIDMLNGMLASLELAHENFHYVDLRGLIGAGRGSWVNELHVKSSVCAAIAAALDARMRAEGVWETRAGPRGATNKKRRR